MIEKGTYQHLCWVHQRRGEGSGRWVREKGQGERSGEKGQEPTSVFVEYTSVFEHSLEHILTVNLTPHVAVILRIIAPWSELILLSSFSQPLPRRLYRQNAVLLSVYTVHNAVLLLDYTVQYAVVLLSLPAMCPNWAAKLVPSGAGVPITLRQASLKLWAVSAQSLVWISWSNRPNTSCLARGGLTFFSTQNLKLPHMWKSVL